MLDSSSLLAVKRTSGSCGLSVTPLSATDLKKSNPLSERLFALNTKVPYSIELYLPQSLILFSSLSVFQGSLNPYCNVFVCCRCLFIGCTWDWDSISHTCMPWIVMRSSSIVSAAPISSSWYSWPFTIYMTLYFAVIASCNVAPLFITVMCSYYGASSTLHKNPNFKIFKNPILKIFPLHIWMHWWLRDFFFLNLIIQVKKGEGATNCSTMNDYRSVLKFRQEKIDIFFKKDIFPLS